MTLIYTQRFHGNVVVVVVWVGSWQHWLPFFLFRPLSVVKWGLLGKWKKECVRFYLRSDTLCSVHSTYTWYSEQSKASNRSRQTFFALVGINEDYREVESSPSPYRNGGKTQNMDFFLHVRVKVFFYVVNVYCFF